MSLKKSIVIIILVLLIDQISKIYVKTHFSLGDGVKVFQWFQILFVENEGMAWGAKIPGEYGKLFLTLFRLFAIAGIGYWLWDSIKKKTSRVLIVAIAFIFAGAFGNIIDSVVYGIIFNDSHHQVASFFPPEGGYGTLFHGKVVDHPVTVSTTKEVSLSVVPLVNTALAGAPLYPFRTGKAIIFS